MSRGGICKQKQSKEGFWAAWKDISSNKYIIPTQHLQMQAGNVQLPIAGYRNHSNIVLFALPSLVSCQLKKKDAVSSKIQGTAIVKGTSGCGLSWALGRECPGTFEESAGCMCWRPLELPSALPPYAGCRLLSLTPCGHHEDQQMNVLS